MKGTRILITSKPRGVFEDVYVQGTPKPGTVMEVKPSVEAVGGVFRYQAYGVQAADGGQYVAADGDRKAIAVLLERDQDGSIYSDAYVDGDLGRVYFPAMGEHLNMILEDVSGTSDTFIIGEELMVDNGTGKLITADSDAQAHPFTLMETVAAAQTADHVRHCRFNGEGGA